MHKAALPHHRALLITASYPHCTLDEDIAPCSLVEADRRLEKLTASIMRSMMFTLMMEAVSTSEISVNFYETIWRNIPEDSNLHTRRHENLNNPTVLFQGEFF
jgi:hypothetical protein